MLKLKLVLNSAVIGLLLAVSNAYAICSPNITNTSNSSATTLSSSTVGDCVLNSGTITTSAAPGVASSAESTTNTNNGTITTNGDFASGISSAAGFANTSNTSNINNGSISTNGQNSHGIVNGLGSGSVNINNAAIKTSGDYSVGIFGVSFSSNDTITNSGTITTSGFQSPGISSLGDNATLRNSGVIYTINNNSAGISSKGSNAIITNTGSIITLGDDSPAPRISADGIASYGAASIINNRGLVSTSGPNAFGIFSIGNDVSITNSGVISASGLNSHGIYSGGSNASINNTGVISTTGVDGNGIYNSGIINLLQNDGSIKVAVLSGGGNCGVTNLNQIGTINNAGLIDLREAYKGIGLLNGGYGFSGTITTLNNSGLIYGNFYTGAGIENSGNNPSTFTSLNNSGEISGDFGIDNRGTIQSLSNRGTITGNTLGVFNIGQITTLTNIGAISGGLVGIQNGGAGFITLNNAQGGNGISLATTALTYSGDLPANYNLIINSPAHYGQLHTDGTTSLPTNFGIYAGSYVTNRLYSSVIGNAIGQVNNLTSTTSYDNLNWALLQNGNNYDLRFSGFNAAGTQASLQASALSLRNIFNQAIASSNFANMNTYDCNSFDAHGMCISAGGRYTNLDDPNLNMTSAVLVVGYKATTNIRIGGFLDQSVSNNLPVGIKLSNKSPLMGVFAFWNQNEDGLGYQVKVANAYQDKDVTTTRDGTTFTAESGSGTTKLNIQSYVAELSYAFADQYDTIVRPYVAFRHTSIKQDAYAERGITTPLTYAALTDRSTTALFGIKFNHAVSTQTNITASVGLEQDLQQHTDKYSATGIDGLAPENFSSTINHTRRVASVGAYYAVSKTQRVSGDVYFQELPFQSTGTTTAYFSYMIGL